MIVWFACLVGDVGRHGRFEVRRPADAVRWVDGAEPGWDPWVVTSALRGMAIRRGSGCCRRASGGASSIWLSRPPGGSTLCWGRQWARRARRRPG